MFNETQTEFVLDNIPTTNELVAKVIAVSAMHDAGIPVGKMVHGINVSKGEHDGELKVTISFIDMPADDEPEATTHEDEREDTPVPESGTGWGTKLAVGAAIIAAVGAAWWYCTKE